MANTLNQSFSIFKSNLEITDLQLSTISVRQNMIRDLIKGKFKVLDSFLAGSYQRKTMIAPLSKADIDIFIVLDPIHYQKTGQEYLLNQIRSLLKQRYSTTRDICRNGQAVTISFTEFEVDVVPCFYGEYSGYLIPDSGKHIWIPTDPKKHIEIWSKANQFHEGKLVPLLKMLKMWNRNNGQRLRSFHLESWILKTFSKTPISDEISAFTHFFDIMSQQIRSPVEDPAGYSNNLNSYLSSSEIYIISSAVNSSRKSAYEALSYIQTGKEKEAIDEYKKIFGTYFPAFG